MNLRRSVWNPGLKAPILLGAALTVTFGAGLTDTDQMVEHRFTAALADRTQTSGEQASTVPVAGSEAYWLAKSSLGGDPSSSIEPVKWTAPVSAGDRVQVTAEGKRQILEVVSVSEAAADVTRIQTGPDAGRRFDITCRDEQGRVATLRLDGDGSFSLLPASVPADRAL